MLDYGHKKLSLNGPRAQIVRTHVFSKVWQQGAPEQSVPLQEKKPGVIAIILVWVTRYFSLPDNSCKHKSDMTAQELGRGETNAWPYI
jgi:hypothetical protein